MADPEKAWKLCLFGKFELTAPNGDVVQLANRKVEGLIAVLAVNRETGMERGEIGQILWPGSPISKRQENLRQTVARARKGLGAENLESSRTHCRFSDSLCIDTDWDDAGLRKSGPFMPGFDETWFEAIRRNGSANQPPRRILESFLHLLEWLSVRDPGQLLGMMRENHGLTFGLNSPDRARLLGLAQSGRGVPGWKGLLSTGLWAAGETTATALPKLSRVILIAEAQNDLLLTIQASSQLSFFLGRQNRCGEALEAAEWCCATASRSSDRELWATSIQMKGNILAQMGRVDEGLPMLEQAAQIYKDPIDSAIMRTLQAYFLAGTGRPTEAAERLESARSTRRDTGHGFLNVAWDYAQALLVSRDKSPQDAVQDFLRLERDAAMYANGDMNILVAEELAKTYRRMGDIEKANAYAKSARNLRSSLVIGYTPWDRIRLSA